MEDKKHFISLRSLIQGKKKIQLDSPTLIRYDFSNHILDLYFKTTWQVQNLQYVNSKYFFFKFCLFVSNFYS